MAIEMNSDRVICTRCGRAFGKRTGYFQTSYAALHKGIGYLPICKTCVDLLFSEYLSTCKNPELAVRQMCRKLDLYWNKKIYDAVEKKNSQRTIITAYITRVNTANFAGKCYDDTLLEEGTLWSIGTSQKPNIAQPLASMPDLCENDKGNIEISEATINAWGTGYSPEMYLALDKRYSYWLYEMHLSNDSSLDVGTKALIRQICSLELDINRDRADGKPVDKSVTVLNNLLGSLNLKPVQKKPDANENVDMQTPFGVWIHKYENLRPIPGDDSDEDADGIVKFVLTWLYGHLGKMLNIESVRSKLYDEAIEALRVSKPEYNDESDDEMLYDIFSQGGEEYELGDESDEDSPHKDDLDDDEGVVG